MGTHTYEYQMQRLARMKAERPDDYEREMENRRRWRIEKYKTDYAYRERRKAQAREAYYKKKQQNTSQQ